MNRTKLGQGHFFVAKYQQELDIVESDVVRMTIFSPEHPKRFMVTTKLNSSSVVMNVSRFAAIMANILPRGPRTPANLSGRVHANSMLRWIKFLYDRNSGYFLPGTTQVWCWIVTPIDPQSAQLVLETQQALMQASLTGMDLQPNEAHYHTVPEHFFIQEGRSIVCIDGRGNDGTEND